MTDIAPEIVEKAARALYQRFRENMPDRDDLDVWEERLPNLHEHYHSGVRAALEAVLPDLHAAWEKDKKP